MNFISSANIFLDVRTDKR